jgi:hypothetical protein
LVALVSPNVSRITATNGTSCVMPKDVSHDRQDKVNNWAVSPTGVAFQ